MIAEQLKSVMALLNCISNNSVVKWFRLLQPFYQVFMQVANVVCNNLSCSNMHDTATNLQCTGFNYLLKSKSPEDE